MKNTKKLKFDTNFILGTFNLTVNLRCDILDKWLNTTIIVPPQHHALLEHHRQLLALEGNFWNEEELKMLFISPILAVANLRESQKIRVFYERPLNGIINDYTISVICDCLVAKPFGVYAPDTPYFFLQEFKKSKNATDAEAQMLAAMLIAQKQNANDKPVYGCWLQGKYWIFTVLHDKNYCISNSYDASQKDELHQIIAILMQLKHIILTELI